MWSAGEGDDKLRFLADLRALRGTAALGYDELAARAHYPGDILKQAENGPSLPGLPILAAYVRACDGNVSEWEERWRRLGYEALVDPGLPVRPAGTSPAAVAGARASISVAPPDAYDPERIKAALRGDVRHADQATQRTGNQGTGAAGPDRTEPDTAAAPQDPTDLRAPESPAGWDGTARWDAHAGTDVWDTRAGKETSAGWWASTAWEADAQGNTGASRDTGPSLDTGTRWDAGASRDTRASRDTGTRWDAAADQASTPTSGNHHARRWGDAPFDVTVTETPDPVASARAIRRDPFSASWLQNSEPVSPPEVAPGWQDRADTERPPAAQDARLTSPDPADSQPAWRPADAGFTPPDPADRGLTPRQGDGGLASPGRTDFGARAATPPSESRRDRLYPLRLLAVVVIAALIGSILVMLLT
jgi:hypothetical protein